MTLQRENLDMKTIRDDTEKNREYLSIVFVWLLRCLLVWVSSRTFFSSINAEFSRRKSATILFKSILLQIRSPSLFTISACATTIFVDLIYSLATLK